MTQRKFSLDRFTTRPIDGWSHIGISFDPSKVIATHVDGAMGAVVRALDISTLVELAAVAGSRPEDIAAFERLQLSLAIDDSTAWVVEVGGAPILACRRVPGGEKTRQSLRETVGQYLPNVSEREHLLTALVLSETATVAQITSALAAMVTIDPPGNLTRTLLIEPVQRDGRIQAASLAAGGIHYISCQANRSRWLWWKIRFDWLGPTAVESAATQDVSDQPAESPNAARSPAETARNQNYSNQSAHIEEPTNA